MDDQDGCADTAAVSNDRLKQRLHAKRLSPLRFVALVGVC